MEQEYQLLTVSKLEERKEDFSKVGDALEYNTIKRLYAYMKEHGAVREDVYEYLLENMVFQEYSLLILNNLVKTFAGPEWFQLIKKTEERKNDYNASKGSIGLFQQLILEAYREDIPYAYVAQVLETAKHPYEVSQKMEQYRKEKREKLEKTMDELKSAIEEVQKDKKVASEIKITDLMPEDLKKCPENNQEDLEILSEVLNFEKTIELQETDAEIEEPENTHMLLLIQKLLEENEQQYKGLITLHTWIKESGKDLSMPIMPVFEGGEEETREVAQKEIQEEVEEKGVSKSTDTVITEQKSEKKEMSLAKLFQKLREWKKITSFKKLTDKKKLEELFRMMNGRNYSEKMIIAIRDCIALGVSFEFLYTLIEMDAGEEEFEKLILFRSAEKEEKELENKQQNNEIKNVKDKAVVEPDYMEGDVWNAE